MKKNITLLLGLILLASSASAYEKTAFQAYIDVRSSKKINLVKLESGGLPSGLERDKGRALWYTGPRLDNRWQTFSFAFVAEDEGQVCLRFGPEGDGDIPFYYEEIRVNGAPLDGAWMFHSPTLEGNRQGAVVSAQGEPIRLAVYFANSVYRVINVKKNERVEVSMRGRSGSFLDALSGRLAEIRTNLDEGSRGGLSIQVMSMEAGPEMVKSLNQFSVLCESTLHISVPPLPSEHVTLESLKAKTAEWINAFEAEKAKTAGEQRPCLYEVAGDRSKLRKEVISAVQLSAKLQTAGLLNFIFKSRM